MKNYEKTAILTSLILAIIGLALGLYFDGTYFSRTGSLIIIVGIIYGFQELPSKLANIDAWARDQASKAKPALISNLKDMGANDSTAEKVYEKTVEETLIAINAAAKTKKKELVFIECAILISGTLIWGFGDLINPISAC